LPEINQIELIESAEKPVANYSLNPEGSKFISRYSTRIYGHIVDIKSDALLFRKRLLRLQVKQPGVIKCQLGSSTCWNKVSNRLRA
jgi:hypothetical protein